MNADARHRKDAIINPVPVSMSHASTTVADRPQKEHGDLNEPVSQASSTVPAQPQKEHGGLDETVNHSASALPVQLRKESSGLDETVSHTSTAVPVQPHKTHSGLNEQASLYEAADVVRHIAHELRQPLSTIESIAYYLDIVLPQHDSKARLQVEKLQQVVQQAGWILSDAVHFLQASPLSPQTIDLCEFVSEAVCESGATDTTWVRLDLASEPVLARLDPDQARHLFRNVLMFFHQVSRPNPFVSVTSRTAVESAEVRFEAEGVDFSTAEVEAMFEPFTSHLPAGSGLALASVRRIVEAHRGSFDLHATASRKLCLSLSFDSIKT